MTVLISDGLIDFSSLINQLGRIESKIDTLTTKENKEMALIDDLQATVAQQTTVIGSVVTLVQGLKAALDAAGTDPVKLQAIKDALDANDTTLANLVVQNTPASGNPAPGPTPAPPTV